MTQTETPATAKTAQPSATVPYEKFLASQQMVGALIKERDRNVFLLKKLLALVPNDDWMHETGSGPADSGQAVERVMEYLAAWERAHGGCVPEPVALPIFPPFEPPD